jgi:hypothetical protein
MELDNTIFMLAERERLHHIQVSFRVILSAILSLNHTLAQCYHVSNGCMDISYVLI